MSVGPYHAGILRWESLLQNFSPESLLGVPANKRKQDFLWLLSLSFDFYSLFDVKWGKSNFFLTSYLDTNTFSFKQFATSVYFSIHDSLQSIISLLSFLLYAAQTQTLAHRRTLGMAKPIKSVLVECIFILGLASLLLTGEVRQIFPFPIKYLLI